MINYDLRKIRAVVFDVDGVLSCSTVLMNADGEPVRTLNIKDGYAIQLAVKMGLRLAIMTGGRNEEIRKRYNYLGVEDVYLSCAVKVTVWEEFLHKYGLTDEEVMEKLSVVNIAEIMNELNYGDDTWKEEEIQNESN